MKKILLLMSVAMLFACTQGDAQKFIEDPKTNDKPTEPDDGINGGPILNTVVEMILEDENGVDLLNRSNAKYSPIVVGSDIKIYSQKDGEFKLYKCFDEDFCRLNNYNGYKILNDTPSNFWGIVVSVLNNGLENYYTHKTMASTIIDWGNGVKDTIVVDVMKNKGVEDTELVRYRLGFCKVWVNGKLVWDEDKFNPDGGDSSYIKLVMSKGKTSSTAYSYLKALQ